MMVIGFTGPARVGKDTAADALLAYLRRSVKISFADPMKSMLEHVGLTKNQLHGDEKDQFDPRFGTTPRRMLQTLGTEWGRNIIHPDVWVTATEERVKKLVSDYDYEYILIPDVRFENEAAMVRRMGVLFHISGRGGIEGNHASEAGVSMLPEDRMLLNGKGLAEFRSTVIAEFTNISRSR
jgi:hypothetical protein